MSNSGTNWRWLRTAFVVVMLVVAGVSWFGRKSMLGTKLKISDLETVNYSGNATEQDARSLGQSLQQIGFFDGQVAKDVLFKKGDEGIVVSFVLQSGKWNDPGIVDGFEVFGRRIAPSVGGPPLTVHLIDDKLNTKETLSITIAEHWLEFSEQETVIYFSNVTEDEARTLGQALHDIGYFDDSAPAMVMLEKSNEDFTVSFLVPDGTWDSQEQIDIFEGMGRQIAPTLGVNQLTVQLVDVNRVNKLAMTID